MKFYLVLGLLFIGVKGENKINLEDIERDNLRVEGISKSGIARVEETKYPTKPEIGQQQYQISYRGPTSAPVAYVTPPSVQNFPSNAYATKEQVYQQQNNILPESILPQRYYNEYEQQSSPPSKGNIVPNIYDESQQLAYQQEVNVGNQLQAIRQKTVTAKFEKNVNKEPIYVDIPTMHLLTYYPNLDVNPGKNSGFFLPQLTTTASNHISIPLYATTISQKPTITPVKQTYQIQYAPKYNAVPGASSTKMTKNAVYSAPFTSKKLAGTQVLNVPAYAPPLDQSYAQGRQLLYTQAYIAPSQPQYVSQLVYAQPAAIYMQATPVYTDVYARPPSHDRDNSLQGKYAAPIEHTQVVDDLSNHVLGKQSSQAAVTQNYVKDSEGPNADLVPPQVPPQDFKSGATPLSSVPARDEESIPEQNQIGSSEPRSLLDSYIPSKLIAAHDSSRYQERPIQLERGFLPSKENFLYKKRKID